MAATTDAGMRRAGVGDELEAAGRSALHEPAGGTTPADEPDPAGRPLHSAAAAHWTAVGPRDATAIVFVHGTRLSRRQWWPQLRRLSRRYRCIAIDLPGHGTRADEHFTIAGAAAAVAEAISAEAAGGRAFVVGLSLGGYVAIDAAERYPERVLGLLLAGCSAEPVGPATMPFRGFAWAMERVPRRGLQVVNLAFFRTRYSRAISQPIVDGGFWPTGGAQALRTIVGRRYADRLARLWVPITVVNGAFDPVFGPGGDPWAVAARRGRHVLVPWALHLSNLDRPTTFSAIVAEAVEDALANPAEAVWDIARSTPAGPR